MTVMLAMAVTMMCAPTPRRSHGDPTSHRFQRNLGNQRGASASEFPRPVPVILKEESRQQARGITQ